LRLRVGAQRLEVEPLFEKLRALLLHQVRLFVEVLPLDAEQAANLVGLVARALRRLAGVALGGRQLVEPRRAVALVPRRLGPFGEQLRVHPLDVPRALLRRGGLVPRLLARELELGQRGLQRGARLFFAALACLEVRARGEPQLLELLAEARALRGLELELAPL